MPCPVCVLQVVKVDEGRTGKQKIRSSISRAHKGVCDMGQYKEEDGGSMQNNEKWMGVRRRRMMMRPAMCYINI